MFAHVAGKVTFFVGACWKILEGASTLVCDLIILLLELFTDVSARFTDL